MQKSYLYQQIQQSYEFLLFSYNHKDVCMVLPDDKSYAPHETLIL